MPLDPYGRVIINPRIPLSTEDFQQLYTREGATPDEAGHNIFQRYPMEVRGYLDSEASRLGIGDPAAYVRAHPLAAKAAAAAPAATITSPSGAQIPVTPSSPITGRTILGPNITQADVGPLPNTDKLKIIQQHQAEVEAGRVLESLPTLQRQRDSLGNVPVPQPGMKGAPLLNAQLAGDSGDVKKFLLKQRGVQYDENYLMRPTTPDFFNPRQQQIRQAPQAYIPEGGVGQLQGTATPSRLDMNIVNDKDFQDLLAKEPDRARFMYLRLTGRQYDNDYKETVGLRQEQLKVGQNYAKEAIARGAQFDPVKKTWKVWQNAEAPANDTGIGLTTPRPYTQMVDATPEQNHWLNTHYESITGSPLREIRADTTGRIIDPSVGARGAAQHLQRLQNDPTFTGKVSEMQNKLKRSLLPSEIERIANDTDAFNAQKATNDSSGWFTKTREYNEQAWRWLFGLKGEATSNPFVDLWNRDKNHPEEARPTDQAIRDYDSDYEAAKAAELFDIKNGTLTPEQSTYWKPNREPQPIIPPGRSRPMNAILGSR